VETEMPAAADFDIFDTQMTIRHPVVLPRALECPDKSGCNRLVGGRP
jgi:hypothetical protein